MTDNGNSRKLKSEIERRTQNTTKLIALEAQKVAIGEMVVERLDEIMALLHEAGFKLGRKLMAAQLASPPPNTVVVQPAQLTDQSAGPVKNPCSLCGQEATHDENLPDGKKKFYCRTHAQARAREKAEEQQTVALMGSSGTLYQRPTNPNAPPPQKTIIQAPADPLKGPFTNGEPPQNNVLDD